MLSYEMSQLFYLILHESCNDCGLVLAFSVTIWFKIFATLLIFFFNITKTLIIYLLFRPSPTRFIVIIYSIKKEPRVI